VGVSDVGRPRTDYTKLSYDGNAGISTFEGIFMSKLIHAHTPPFDGDTYPVDSAPYEHRMPVPDTEDFVFSHFKDIDRTAGITMRSAADIGTIDYKFNEGKLIEEFKDYIDSTYNAHYCTSGIQSSEVIIDRGHGMGFFLGNVDKYNARYGNKGDVSDHRKDLVKVLHYALLALHTHDLENK
jgi:hypothetical protein